MHYQLEITTRCNFDCFYCAGRTMDQRDITWDRFTSIIDAIDTAGARVTLQGEGEPTLHPKFFDMARYVASKGLTPHAIINGSRVAVNMISELFPLISISLDTLDIHESARIGRHNLPKVISNINLLIESMGANRITIMTVDYGQPLSELSAWVFRSQARHIVQPLQQKDDYAKRYTIPRQLPKHIVSGCRFVNKPTMRYYPLNGPELPCCFIKDTSGIDSIEHLASRLQRNDVPLGCAGCRYLTT
jgi:hypothetical protein